MSRFLKVLVCLILVFSCGSAVLARPHHSAPKHVQSQSDSDDATSASNSSGEASDTSAQAESSEDTSIDTGTGSGTIRVNNLANLEALLNIIANLMEIFGIAVGGPLLIFGVPAGLILLFLKDAKGKRWLGALLVVVGPVLVTVGLTAPTVINMIFKSLTALK